MKLMRSALATEKLLKKLGCKFLNISLGAWGGATPKYEAWLNADKQQAYAF